VSKPAPARIELEKVGELRNAFVVKDKVSGATFRLPKDPKKIPDKSVLIGTVDRTSEARSFVEKLLAKEEEKEGGK